MIEHVVNSVYVAVMFVYYFPFIATMLYPEFVAQGLTKEVPAWVSDTSWKGFVLSPYRMLKEIM